MPKKKAVKKAVKQEEKVEIKNISEEEYEKKVIELAKEGLTSEKIGEKLRQQKIHPKEHKKISKILKEKNLYVQPDLKNTEKKLENIKIHVGKNKNDKRARRENERIFAQLRKLKNYYKPINH